MSSGTVLHAVLAIPAILSNVVAWYAVGRRHFLTSLLDFLLGWIPAELPLASLAAQVFLLVGSRLAGWVTGPFAVTVTVVQALSWLLLLDLAREARRTRTLTVAALARDWPGMLAGPAGHPRQAGPERFGALRRIARARETYAVERDIAYGPDRAQHLDIWRAPDSGPGSEVPPDPAIERAPLAPVIVHVPGGGWVYGDTRHQGYALLSHLVERGWVGVSMAYRLSPKHRFPAHIEDVKRVIAWVRDNISDHGGDPDFVVLTGGSAGGHLVALAGLTAGDTAYQPGFEEADTSVAAVVSMYPMPDWTDDGGIGHRGGRRHIARTVLGVPYAGHEDAFRLASPTFRVHAGAPPFVVAHGTNDEMIPVEQADAFVARLREVSTSPVVYFRLPRAHHGFDVLGSVRTRAVVAAVGDVLGTLFSARRGGGGGPR